MVSKNSAKNAPLFNVRKAERFAPESFSLRDKKVATVKTSQ